jgi:hypothetical protein
LFMIFVHSRPIARPEEAGGLDLAMGWGVFGGL